MLIQNLNQAIDRDAIIDEVWGTQQYPSQRSVDNHIVRLRKYCEQGNDGKVKIVSVRGVGYKMQVLT